LTPTVHHLKRRDRSDTRSMMSMCTNMRGAAPAARLESELGIPILDSVAVTLWAALDAVGGDKVPFLKWGRMFKI
jgi:maleate isomerase